METKKNKKYDLERRRPLFFGIGLVVALAMTISAFELKTEIDPINFWDSSREEVWLDNELIISTEHEKPKPPKPKPVTPPAQSLDATNEVEKEIEQEIEIDVELIDDESAPEYYGDSLTVEVVEEPFLFVEKMPEFPGGDHSLLSFLATNINYPRRAKHLGIEGRVSIDFVIEKDGSVSQVRLKRGIGAGCDEEAIRVVGLLSDFSPGKQRGVPVRVQMSVPINFRLQ